jgi:hypothetical protein
MKSIGQLLVEENDKKVVANVIDYRKTRIACTEGGAESIPIPYMRDAAIAAFHRSKSMHRALDRVLCDSTIAQSSPEYERLHDALDRTLDESPVEQDDEEEEEEEEEISASRISELQSDRRAGRMRSGDSRRAPQAIHDLLDMILDSVAAKDKSSAKDSEQSRQGGGCGKSFACDTGWLTEKAYHENSRLRIH